MTVKNHIGKLLTVFLAVLLSTVAICANLPSFYYQAQAGSQAGRYDVIEPDYYYVTFNDWDNAELKVIRVPKYYDAIPPQDPVREGYTFIGWDKDFTDVQQDIIITAQYRSDEPSQGSILGLWVWMGVLAVCISAFVFIKIQEKKPLPSKDKSQAQNSKLDQDDK